MNEFKGTPGPWKIMSDSPEGFEIESEHESSFWAFVSYDTPEAERMANAQLIAAAPELLSDLKEAAQLLRNYEKLHRRKGTIDGFVKADRNRAWAEQFEATIAKALGEKS